MSMFDDILKLALKGSDNEKIKASPNAFNAPVPEAQRLKKEYIKQAGLPQPRFTPKVTEVDVARSKRIADAYENLKHTPNDPEVIKAMDAFAKETEAQFQFLLDNGIKFEYWRGKGEPYKSSKEMSDDLRNNRRLKVLATEGNFGVKEITPEMRATNPALRVTRFKDQDGNPLYVNDLIRGVHDFFGHATGGTGFGPVGEKGALTQHFQMYSPEARKMLITGTDGQNSWVNFGPHLRRPDGSLPKKGDPDYLPPELRPFAENKVGILPEEFLGPQYQGFLNSAEFKDSVAKIKSYLEIPGEKNPRTLAKLAGISLAGATTILASNEAEGGYWGPTFQIITKVADEFEAAKKYKTGTLAEGRNVSFLKPQDQAQAELYDAFRLQKPESGEPVFDKVDDGSGIFAVGEKGERILGRSRFTMPMEYRDQLGRLGVSSPDLIELDSADGAKFFSDQIKKSKSENKHSAAVYVYPEDEYKTMRLFVTEDGTAGYAIKPDGSMVSAFKFEKSPHKGFAPYAIFHGIEQGGTKGDAFDTVLPKIYSIAGLKGGSRLKWDESQSPPDWDKALFSDFNKGEPDVVFLSKRDPREKAEPYDPEKTPIARDYPEAVEMQKGAIDSENFASGIIKKMKQKLVAYHGTPHEVDKFSSSKIGTGEGAAAYGHGLYFAENPEVAKQYQESLRPMTDIIDLEVGGVPVISKGKYADYSPTQYTDKPKPSDYARARLQESLMVDEWKIREAWDKKGEEGVKQIVLDFINEDLQYLPNDWPELVPEMEKIKDKILSGDTKTKFKKGKSNLYKVELDIDPDTEMLDWDKPLSEQNSKIIYAYKKYLKSPEGMEYAKQWSRHKEGMPLDQAEPLLSIKNDPSIHNLYNNAFPSREAANKFFQQNGIKGIKYSDQMSRGAEGGTSNFVVFDDSLIRIAEKNGIPFEQVKSVAKKRGITNQQALGMMIGGSAGTMLYPEQEAQASALSLVDDLRKAAQKTGLAPEKITVDSRGFISYPDNYINPLAESGAGEVREAIARHNDSVLQTDTRSTYKDDKDRTYHATGARANRTIGDFNLDIPTEIDDSGRGLFTAATGKNASTYAPKQSSARTGSGYVMPLVQKKGLSEVVVNVPPKPDGGRYDFNNFNVPGATITIPGEAPRPLSDYYGDKPVSTNIIEGHVRRNGFDSLRISGINDPGPNFYGSPEEVKKNPGAFYDEGADIVVNFKSENLRSPWAAFDPQFEGSKNLLGQADPKLLAATAAAGTAAAVSPAIPAPEKDSFVASVEKLKETQKQLREKSAQGDKDVMNWLAYYGEPAITLANSLGVAAATGLAGIPELVAAGLVPEEGKTRLESVRGAADDAVKTIENLAAESYIYQPMTESGQQGLSDFAGFVENVGQQLMETDADIEEATGISPYKALMRSMEWLNNNTSPEVVVALSTAAAFASPKKLVALPKSLYKIKTPE